MSDHDIINRPLITEKTTMQKEAHNQVSFEVDPRANRVQIQRAVEKIFKVKVAGVRTLQIKGKIKRRGQDHSVNARTGRKPSSS